MFHPREDLALFCGKKSGSLALDFGLFQTGIATKSTKFPSARREPPARL
ncbi:hypothetical protein OPIT5_01760 [Opitutaceae bacterium TAV5]|nr:hypothetical protein OPIT5_01760 [Opitutaceae bacterium TAV5]